MMERCRVSTEEWKKCRTRPRQDIKQGKSWTAAGSHSGKHDSVPVKFFDKRRVRQCSISNLDTKLFSREKIQEKANHKGRAREARILLPKSQ